MMAFLLASLWALPATAAAAGFLLAVVCGGDWRLAAIVSVTLGGAVLASRLLGTRAALAILGAGAVLFADRRGYRRGAARQMEKEKVDADHAVARAQRARSDADRRNAGAERLRDEDGFRRD